ncbi:hypothetical protein GUJ93_ZPchr0012g21471 [Zizania palustris]|uniref:Uncharacterized protein n=1 Tax=Zizania palustris TaxID=103762 RepID=A0A8J5WSJ4_ZIZPA|nr:hypothetical protein GUJ93_ZPchr0012g21471 [Zizania palustris]
MQNVVPAKEIMVFIIDECLCCSHTRIEDCLTGGSWIVKSLLKSGAGVRGENTVAIHLESHRCRGRAPFTAGAGSTRLHSRHLPTAGAPTPPPPPTEESAASARPPVAVARICGSFQREKTEERRGLRIGRKTSVSGGRTHAPPVAGAGLLPPAPPLFGRILLIKV